MAYDSTKVKAQIGQAARGSRSDLGSALRAIEGQVATLDSTELGFIDGVTAGTVTASKAVVVDANKDASAFRDITARSVLGLGAAQGVAITITGGISSTQGNAGGAATIAGSPGVVGTTTTAGSVGGAASITSGAGGAKTGTGAAAGGAAGAASVVGGVGGATASSGSDAGGRGGNVSVTAGTGGAATAGTGNGGEGADVILTAGVGGASAGGTAGVAGFVYNRSSVSFKTTVTAMTTTATITGAAILGGLITANQGAAGAATYTMPAGTVFGPLLPASFAVGDTVQFSITNLSTVAAEDVTVAGASGMVAKGNMFIPSNAATSDVAFGTFLIIKTGSNAFDFYRIG